jgi:hypothetical protein
VKVVGFPDYSPLSAVSACPVIILPLLVFFPPIAY